MNPIAKFGKVGFVSGQQSTRKLGSVDDMRLWRGPALPRRVGGCLDSQGGSGSKGEALETPEGNRPAPRYVPFPLRRRDS